MGDNRRTHKNFSETCIKSSLMVCGTSESLVSVLGLFVDRVTGDETAECNLKEV